MKILLAGRKKAVIDFYLSKTESVVGKEFPQSSSESSNLLCPLREQPKTDSKLVTLNTNIWWIKTRSFLVTCYLRLTATYNKELDFFVQLYQNLLKGQQQSHPLFMCESINNRHIWPDNYQVYVRESKTKRHIMSVALFITVQKRSVYSYNTTVNTSWKVLWTLKSDGVSY